jgi:hypothetical protein
MLAVAVAVLSTRPMLAAPITWIGGNADWDAVAGGKWNPADEPDPDDEAIFNTPNSVDLANASESIQALTMSVGIDLDTNGNDLTVNGLISLSDGGTNLFVGGADSLLLVDNVDVNANASLVMSAGTMTVADASGTGSLDINANGSLSGNGVINFNDSFVAVTDVMDNFGTLSAAATGLIIIGNPPARTLTINVADADGRVDLDAGANAVVNVFRNQTLDINAMLTDPYSTDMNLSHNSTIDIREPWTLDAGGTIDVNNGFVPGSVFPFSPDIPAEVAFIAGGAFTQTGGTITVIDGDGTLQFNSAFTQTGGTLANNGLVVFNANATIGVGGDLVMSGATASLTINAGVTVNVDQPNLNIDGGNTNTNIITVNSGGLLDLDLGVGGDAIFNNVVTLNGGELDVTTAGGVWTIARTVNLNHTSGAPGVLDGDSLLIGNDAGSLDANVNVGGAGPSQINTPVTFFSDADVNIAAGATLELNGSATFDTANGANNAEFTGSGILELDGGNNTVSEAMTVNMPGGRIDLDGSGAILAGAQTLTLGGANNNADLTLNVTAIDSTDNSFGKSGILGPDTIVLNLFSDLVVNLTDPNGEWTLNGSAVLDINAIGGNLGGSGIGGSDLNMAGTANISGNSIWTARTDISGTVNVALNGSFNLRGGDLTDANVNRLEGGTITGAGVVRALVDEGLFGFGTIDADVDFPNNTELRAAGGMLTVNGAILDLGVIGTAAADGILNIPAAWNTATNIGLVDMRGGEIRGGTITNDNVGGINGFGLIASRVFNNTRIDAEGGGLLVVETAGNNNDWDGAGNTGRLNAVSGDLEIRDTATFAFSGIVGVSPGRTVLASGFALEFQPASTLNLNEGTYSATNSTRIGGTVNVAAGPDSTIAIAGNLVFENGSATSLTGNLRVDGAATVIEVGADFTGGGSLINVPDRTLRLLDGVASGDLAVLVQNEGRLELGAPGTPGQVQGTDYEQAATGVWQADLGGLGLNDFDRMNLTGAASLAGALELTLIDLGGGPYVPALGDTLNILSATGGVTGNFVTVVQPPTMPAGLAFAANNLGTIIQLEVINAPLFTADFDMDGDVDADDLTQWQGDFGMNADSDADADGDSDGADFLAWQQQLGSGLPSVAAAAVVPEPAAVLLLAMGLLLVRAALAVRSTEI